MSNVLEVLRQDHLNLRSLMDLLDREITAMDAGEPSDLGTIEKALDYCLDYSEKHHHPMEDLIYRRLIAKGGEAALAMASLEREHGRLALITEQFANLIREVEHQEMVSRETLVTQGRDFVAAMRRHMDFEDRLFFPLAEDALTEEEWEKIDGEAQRPDDPLFGETVNQHYAAIRAELTMDA